MTIHPELLAMMKDAMYQAFTGQDGAGNNAYGATRTLAVHPEGPTSSMNTSPGDNGATAPDLIETVVFLADYESPGVPAKSKIEFRGIEYRVTQVKTVDDENGPYYQELTCSTNMER